jgi:nitrite reductase (NO-forming)
MRLRLDLSQRVAVLRIAFGLMWAVDAALKWRSSFTHGGFTDQISGAAAGQPGWLQPWFRFWSHVLSLHPVFFAYLTAVVETAIAVGLIIGFARRFGYAVAILFSLAVWAIPEGFGGPYTARAAPTDIGTGIIYAVVFAALYGLETLADHGSWAVDNRLERSVGWWHVVAEPGIDPSARDLRRPRRL